MEILKKLLNKIDRWAMFPKESSVLKALADKLSKINDRYRDSVTVAVDGIIGLDIVALYYVFLMLVMRKKMKKQICVLVVTKRRKDKYLKSNRIYKYFFKTKYVSYEAALNAGEEKKAAERTAAIIKETKNGQDVLNIREIGVNIGPNIYAQYLRNHYVGRIGEIDKNVKDEISKGIRNVYAAEKIVRTYNPDYLLITHSDYHDFGSLFKNMLIKARTAVVTIPYEIGRICGRVYLAPEDYENDPKNYVFSVTDEFFARVKNAFTAEQNDIISKQLNSRYAGKDNSMCGGYHAHTKKYMCEDLKQKLGLKDMDRKVVLIAVHLLWDDATSSYRNVYNGYEEWLKNTLEIIRNNPNMYWIVKGHPSEMHMGTKRYNREIVEETFGGNLPEHIKFIDGDADINTFSLIDLSDVVLTVRGTIGLEAAFKGKKVILGGSGPYSGFSFSENCVTKEEYEKCLLNIHKNTLALSEEQKKDARVACYAYFIEKAPVCGALNYGTAISAFKELKPEEVINDGALGRFADGIICKKRGDLL